MLPISRRTSQELWAPCLGLTIKAAGSQGIERSLLVCTSMPASNDLSHGWVLASSAAQTPWTGRSTAPLSSQPTHSTSSLPNAGLPGATTAPLQLPSQHPHSVAHFCTTTHPFSPVPHSTTFNPTTWSAPRANHTLVPNPLGRATSFSVLHPRSNPDPPHISSFALAAAAITALAASTLSTAACDAPKPPPAASDNSSSYNSGMPDNATLRQSIAGLDKAVKDMWTGVLLDLNGQGKQHGERNLCPQPGQSPTIKINSGMWEILVPINPDASQEVVQQLVYDAFAQLGRNLTVSSSSSLHSNSMMMRVAPVDNENDKPLYVHVTFAMQSHSLFGDVTSSIKVWKEGFLDPFTEQELCTVQKVLTASQSMARSSKSPRQNSAGEGRFGRLTSGGVSSEMEERLQEWLKIGLVFGGGVAALGDAFDSLDRILSGEYGSGLPPQHGEGEEAGELILPPQHKPPQHRPPQHSSGIPVSRREQDEAAAKSRCVVAGHQWPTLEAANAVKQLLAIGAQVIPPGNKEIFEWGVLAGYEDEKRKIEDCVLLPLLHPLVYEKVAQSTRVQYETNRPRGVLFDGPPGTGKTTSARIISTQAAVPLVCVPLEALLSKWYGESEKQLSQVFRAAEALGGCILFLDELDALGGSRDSDMHEASRRLLSVLLREMEGFDATNRGRKAIVIGATNRKSDLDAALLSRFDMVVTFGLPDERSRGLILKRYAQQLADADVEEISRRTAGLSGRDLRDICDHTERVWAAKIIRGEAGADSLPDADEYLSSAQQRLHH